MKSGESNDVKKINIIIADDHDLIRQGLRRIIDFEDDIAIVGEAENGERALELIKSSFPDVVLLDMNMPVMNGIEVLIKAKEQNENVKFIMLTVENDGNAIRASIDEGADGYVLKDSAGEEIIRAIKTVYEGGKYIDKSLVSLLFTDISRERKKARNILDSLSKREAEVLLYISRGLSNKEIGEKIFLSEKTIRNYSTKLFRKLDAADRKHAIIIALHNEIESYYKNKY